MPSPSISQLQRALSIQEQIEKLEAELKSLLSGTASPQGVGHGNGSPRSSAKRKSGMSAEGRARIAEAQRARWAKAKGNAEASKATTEPKTKKKRRKISPEARARIVAAQKKRWAKLRKAKK